MKIFLDKVTTQLQQNLPFVVYKKPDEDYLKGVFQKNDTLFEVNDFKEKGFVFASFDGTQTYLIPENQSDIVSGIWKKNNTYFIDKEIDISNNTDKKRFEDLVAKGIQTIKNNEFQKVVLSRKETVNLNHFDLIEAFEKLIDLYSSTFVYCFFHPKVGIWLGATPEQLLKANDVSFETIALAGTQKDTGSSEIIWKNKEQEEQQYVTDYIVEKLNSVASNVLISKPFSLKAGNIWHIKTNISGVLNADFSLQKVIQLLHPTPAVCGLPMVKSKAFILESENYDRTFYTGFLGELNMENKTDLFVNLRCMEVEFFPKTGITNAHLFMGCGITKDSIPEKEWEESCNKSLTMKKILDLV